MKLIGKYQYNNCLNADDILNKQDEIDKMIKEIKDKLK